jgi:hypothetical protein
VLALVIVLLVTNVISALLLVRRLRPGAPDGDAVEVFEAPRPPGVNERNRRLITIEVLNPLELATARGGRIAGLAGTLAPGLTRRLVYDRVFKTLRIELDKMAVHADVRLHTLRAVARPQPSAPAMPHQATRTDNERVVDAVVVDEVAPLDLGPEPP